jgi:G3E family GTPase
LPALEARLRALEPDVPLVRAVQARIDAQLLRPPELRRDTSRAAAHDHALHAAFVSEVLALEGAVDETALRDRLRSLGAVRAKGFVRTRDGVRLVQGVGRRIELTPEPAPDPGLIGRLVVIRPRS